MCGSFGFGKSAFNLDIGGFGCGDAGELCVESGFEVRVKLADEIGVSTALFVCGLGVGSRRRFALYLF